MTMSRDDRDGRAAGQARLRLKALLVVLAVIAVTVASGATAAQAAITTPFAKVYSINTTGDIQLRGNTLLTCLASDSGCAVARNTAGGGTASNGALNDNNWAMVYVDTDSDASTFNSSSSTVNLPTGATVLYAALVWGGRPAAGTAVTTSTVVGRAAPTPADTNKVKLKAPGAATYSDLTASSTATSSGNYQSFADVTAAVQAAGNGAYTVANVQTGQGGDSYGGWGLAIAYSDTNAPSRNLTIFRGYGSVGSGQSFDIPVTGFTTPPAGPVRTTLGAVSYEGDLGSSGDQLLLGPTTSSLTQVSDSLHAATNVFDSTISDKGVDSSTRSPSYKNQLGFDAATFGVNGYLPNSGTSAVIRVTSSSETYYPGLITFATELYAPNIDTTKTVQVVKQPGNTNAGLVEPGDQLEYTLIGTNNGNDIASGMVLSDPLPTGTTYVPGSMSVDGSALTDVAGDDVGRYNGGSRTLTVHLGNGATAATGGTVPVGGSTGTFQFRVAVDSGVSNTASISNTASVSFSGFTTGTAVSGASTTATAIAVQHRSDLAVTKSADLPSVQKGAGTSVSYTLTVTNAGPYDDSGVSVTDDLPSGTVLGTVISSQGSCSTPAGKVVCNLGMLANGGTAAVTVHAVLDGSPDPSVNTATVAGTNYDPITTDNSASVSTVVNTAPSAGSDTSTTAGGTVTFDPRGNDSDPDGDTLSVSAPGATAPTRGTVVAHPNNTITYTATAGQAGTDTFSYVVDDGRGGSATAQVTITIPNAAPLANDDATSTTVGDAVTVHVLDNDSDANIGVVGSQSLTVSGVTQPAGGLGTVSTNGTTVVFTPDASFTTGTAIFSYTVSDGAGGSDVATVTVTMANSDPVAAADTASTSCVGAVDVDVLGNDSDANHDALVLTGVSGANHGTATVVGSGSAARVHYVPDHGWSGIDTLTYTMTDGTTSTSGPLTVTVGSCSPSAGSFSQSVDGGTSTPVDVLGHVTDPDTGTGDLSVVGTSGPSHGSITVNASGAVVYTPDLTYAGQDSFTYTVGDADGNTATGTVTLTVRNQPPAAQADSALVSINGSVDVPVLSNDTDGNLDSLTVTSVSTPTNGTAVLQSDGSIRYRPNPGYAGSDTFTYDVSDGSGGTDTATVTVGVANVPPVAAADTAIATGTAGSPVTIDVLANDTDVNGDALSLDIVASPAHGTTSIVGGKVVYTPEAGYTGPDTFGYDISDGRGGMATGTVSVDVRNRAPVAVADTVTAASAVSTTVNVVANDSDPDSETLSVASVSPAGHGTAIISSGAHIRYTAANGFQGTDTFTYVVTDPRGGTDTETVTVTVTNAAPIATDVAVDTAGGTAVVVDLAAAASDPDGQALEVISAGPAGHGTVTVDESGRVTYTPQAGFLGVDSFTYLVSDGQGGTAVARVSITVGNTPPNANDDAAATWSGRPVLVNVVGNDGDPNAGQAMQIVTAKVVSGHGTVHVTSDGLLEVTPDDGYTGLLVVTYSISDGAGGIATATVRVRVTKPGAPLPGTAHLTAVATIDVHKRSISLDPADTVKGHGALAVSSVTQPEKGVTVSLADGKLVVTRKGRFAGDVEFTYVVVGADGVTVTVQQTVHVLGVKHELVAEPTEPGPAPGHDTQGSALPHTGASYLVPVGVWGLTLTALGSMLFVIAVRRKEDGR